MFVSSSRNNSGGGEVCRENLALGRSIYPVLSSVEHWAELAAHCRMHLLILASTFICLNISSLCVFDCYTFQPGPYTALSDFQSPTSLKYFSYFSFKCWVIWLLRRYGDWYLKETRSGNLLEISPDLILLPLYLSMFGWMHEIMRPVGMQWSCSGADQQNIFQSRYLRYCMYLISMKIF